MMPLRLHACPRCRGTLNEELGAGNFRYWCCINCGHEESSAGEPEAASANGRQNRAPINTGRTTPKYGGAP